jgi:hypothetical protein
MYKRSREEVMDILDIDIPEVWDSSPPAVRRTIVQKLKQGLPVDQVVNELRGAVGRVDDKRIMDAICEKHRPKNPNPQMR